MDCPFCQIFICQKMLTQKHECNHYIIQQLQTHSLFRGKNQLFHLVQFFVNKDPDINVMICLRHNKVQCLTFHVAT